MSEQTFHIRADADGSDISIQGTITVETLVPRDIGSACTSTASICAGMFEGSGAVDSLIAWADNNGEGGIELYTWIGEMGALSGAMCDELYAATGDFPGIYAYEVDEDFGSWLFEQVSANPKMPQDDVAIKQRLGKYAYDFFFSANLTEDVDVSRVAEIVKKHTGYEVEQVSEVAKVAPVWPFPKSEA